MCILSLYHEYHRISQLEHNSLSKTGVQAMLEWHFHRLAVKQLSYTRCSEIQQFYLSLLTSTFFVRFIQGTEYCFFIINTNLTKYSLEVWRQIHKYHKLLVVTVKLSRFKFHYKPDRINLNWRKILFATLFHFPLSESLRLRDGSIDSRRQADKTVLRLSFPLFLFGRTK